MSPQPCRQNQPADTLISVLGNQEVSTTWVWPCWVSSEVVISGGFGQPAEGLVESTCGLSQVAHSPRLIDKFMMGVVGNACNSSILEAAIPFTT